MDDKLNHFVGIVYTEIGAHLRATDEKRDKTLAIYFIFVVGVSAALVRLKMLPVNFGPDFGKENFNDIGLGILGALFLIGEVVTFSMIGARKWHAEYMNCAIIIQNVMKNGSLDTLTNEVPSDFRERFSASFLTSRNFVITQFGLFVVTMVGLYFVADDRSGDIFKTVLFIFLPLVFWINWFLSDCLLSRAEVNFWDDPLNNWCLVGLRPWSNPPE